MRKSASFKLSTVKNPLRGLTCRRVDRKCDGHTDTQTQVNLYSVDAWRDSDMNRRALSATAELLVVRKRVNYLRCLACVLFVLFFPFLFGFA